MENRAIGYLEDLIEFCQDVTNFMRKLNYDKQVFLESKVDQYGISFCIEQIGELAGKLRNEGYAEKYPSVPWNEMSGLRNRIAHGYFTVDLRIVYDISVNDIPELLKNCREILKQETSLENQIRRAEQRSGTVSSSAPAKENERE